MEKIIFDNRIMKSDKTGLNPWVITKIRKDSKLLIKVADELKISPATLYVVLRKNDERLTQAKVLELIEDHLKVQDTAA